MGDVHQPGGPALEVFDGAPVGVVVTSGPDHRLVYLNLALEQLVGRRPLEVPAREALRGIFRGEHFFDSLDQVIETGRAVTLDEIPAHGERYVSSGIARMSLADGADGLLITLVETTAPARDAVADERHRLLQRYRSLVLALHETHVVWVGDPMGRIVEPSPGWERLSGQTWEQYRGDGWQQAIHPDDREPAADACRQANLQKSHLEQIYRLRQGDGTYRHIRSRAVPVIENGEVVELIGTCMDIEQEWQEQRRRRLLDAAAEATAGLADLEEVLAALAGVIVPELADACGVYVLPELEDDSVSSAFFAERVVSIGRDGLPSSPTRTERISPDSDFARVVRTREPVRRFFPLGAAAQVNSMALVPVVVDGTVVVMVDVVVCGDRDPIGPADVALLRRTLNHAHTHMSNAMRFQRTQRIALALQNYLLPDPPRVPGLEITARYRASATAVEIGGDWYDSFRPRDGSTVLTVGDVAGHDLAAAVTMSQLRNMLRGLAMDRREPPGDILRRLDVAVQSLHDDGLASCILARLERKDDAGWWLTYSVAGHPPPLLVTHDGAARFLDCEVDPLLGATWDLPRSSAVAALPPRATLLLYTDGLVEVPGEHLDQGLERLRRDCAALAREPVDTFCDTLLTQLPTAIKDDIAMIAVRLPDPKV
ncbi:SpoIIE family protein phosphatase [Nonomuraea maritima]|uniref:SpoIIE family protein phosphatase n=1 Tax=Nonomuraea maritima TaxID=683260 RepID=UPI003722A550